MPSVATPTAEEPEEEEEEEAPPPPSMLYDCLQEDLLDYLGHLVLFQEDDAARIEAWTAFHVRILLVGEYVCVMMMMVGSSQK